MAVNWNFGETILSVLQKERDRKQDQEKLAQTMAFENRQLDLLNTFRNKQLSQEQSQFDASLGFKEKGLAQDQEQFESKRGLDLLKLDQDQYEFEKSMELKKSQFDRELGLGWARLGENKVSADDTYSDFATIDTMIGKYNNRTSLDKFDSYKWREDAYGELNKLIKGNDIGQSVIDKVFEVAGIGDNDEPTVKREKLKNVISQLKGLSSNQIQTLYRIAEVRTR